MPRATVDDEAIEHFDLETCPPDGWVDLRKMSYGQLMDRRDMATKMEVEMARRGNGNNKGELQTAQRKVTEFEFKHCVADHNLEDKAGNKLDFSRPGVVASLDPKIGEEIGQRIEAMNMFELDLGNSPAESVPQSS